MIERGKDKKTECVPCVYSQRIQDYTTFTFGRRCPFFKFFFHMRVDFLSVEACSSCRKVGTVYRTVRARISK